MMASLCRNERRTELKELNGASVHKMDDEENTDFLLSAQRGNVNAVKRLLQQGADPNQLNKQGDNALTLAAREGTEQVVLFLLDNLKQVNIDFANKEGNNALLLASKEGHINVVRILLTHKADITFSNQDGRNALHLASLHGHNDIVKLLLENKADIKCRDKRECTSLHLASYGGHRHVVELFLKQKFDMTCKDTDGRTALHLTSMMGNLDVMEILLENNIDVQAANNNGRNALHLAAMKGHKNAVKCLIRHSIDVNCLDNFGRSALHLASYHGHANVVKYLLKHHVEKTCVDKNGCNALHLATLRGHINVVEILFLYSQDSKCTNNNGRNILHLASMEGHKDVVRFLVRSKFNLTDVDNIGRSALHLASSNGHTRVTKYLLKHNADVMGVDKYGCNALHLALYEGHGQTAEILVPYIYQSNKNVTGEKIMLAASVTGHVNVVERLLRYKADTSCVDKRGCNALHLASMEGHTDVVRILLSHGFDSTLTNKYGKNALHCACSKGHLAVVELLTNVGITFSFQKLMSKIESTTDSCDTERNLRKLFCVTYLDFRSTLTGKTALHYAAEKGFSKIVQVLVEAGASLHIKSKTGQTALNLAKGHSGVVNYLRDKKTLRKPRGQKMCISSRSAPVIFAPCQENDTGDTTPKSPALCGLTEINMPDKHKARRATTDVFVEDVASSESIRTTGSVESTDFPESDSIRELDCTREKEEQEGAVGGQTLAEVTSENCKSPDTPMFFTSESTTPDAPPTPASDQPIDVHAMSKELQAVVRKYMKNSSGTCLVQDQQSSVFIVNHHETKVRGRYVALNESTIQFQQNPDDDSSDGETDFDETSDDSDNESSIATKAEEKLEKNGIDLKKR